MTPIFSFITSLKSYWLIIVLAITIVICIALLLFHGSRHNGLTSNAKALFNDLMVVFDGDNYTVTVWFTLLIVCSLILGLFGIFVGEPSIIPHSHWVVLEILILWGIMIAATRFVQNTLLRLLIFILGSWIFLFICVFLFDWPSQFSSSASDKYGYIIGLAGFFASSVGIYISIRVFMKIDSGNKINTVDKYLRETVSVLKNAKEGDEVYIIAPSFCVGIISSDYQLNSIYDLIQERTKNGVLFHLAFPEIGNKQKKKVGCKKLIEFRPSNDHHWGFLCELLDHNNVQSVDSLLDKIYYDNNSYYRQLVDNPKVSIQWLSIDYLHHNRHSNTNNYSGFFATANVGQSVSDNVRKGGGECYMGSFYVSGHQLFFVGSGFNNSYINNSLNSMLENECLRYQLIKD